MDEQRDQPTTFFSLSAELRNSIYIIALAQDNSNQRMPGNCIFVQTAYPHVFEPALMRASKQIRAEVSPIFYGTSYFQSPCATDLIDFLQVCKARGTLHLLRSVQWTWKSEFLEMEKFLVEQRGMFGWAGLRDGVLCVQVKVEGRGLLWLSTEDIWKYREEERVSVRRGIGSRHEWVVVLKEPEA